MRADQQDYNGTVMVQSSEAPGAATRTLQAKSADYTPFLLADQVNKGSCHPPWSGWNLMPWSYSTLRRAFEVTVIGLSRPPGSSCCGLGTGQFVSQTKVVVAVLHTQKTFNSACR
jgi:hypothetical protein